MFYTVHAPLGILISQKTSGIGLIFLLAIISHFVLDIIPHGDIRIRRWHDKKNPQRRFFITLAIDSMVSLVIIALLYFKLKPPTPWPFLAGLFGSALPDLLWLPVKLFPNKILEKYRTLHFKFHYLIHPEMPIWTGLVIQMITASIFVCSILLK